MGGAYPQTPPEACALGAHVSAFGAKKTPTFPSKGVGISVHVIGHVTLRIHKLINDNKKHFDCPPLPS